MENVGDDIVFSRVVEGMTSQLTDALEQAVFVIASAESEKF